MEQTLLIIVLLLLVFGLGAIMYILTQKLNELKQHSSVDMMKSDVTELSRTIAMLQQSMGDKLERSSLSVQTSVQKQLVAGELDFSYASEVGGNKKPA